MNCLIYARVSTERQADKDLSIPAQLQAMREHARRQEWIVLEEFIEPGASGRTADRPILKRLLSRCREEPKVDVVLVHKIDRFARNVYDHATIKAFLRKHGVRLVSVVENVDDSINGQLVENIMASLAEFYSANLGQETKKGMRALVQRGGWPHRAPRGYKLGRDQNGRSVVQLDDTTAPLVKRMFERYATGFVSLKRLQQETAQDGLLGTTGKPMAFSYIRRMLENPFYAGRVQWDKTEYPGRHEPLIDEALFRRVQQTLRDRHKNAGDKGRHRFMLRGVAFCADCGSRMTAEVHDRWSYYRCTRHTRSKAFCGAKFSNVERTHGQMRALCTRLHVSDELRHRIEAEAQAVAFERLQASRARTNSARMQLVKLTERDMRVGDAYASGEMSRDVYRDLTRKTLGERVALETALKESETDSKTLTDNLRSRLDQCATVRDVYLSMRNDEARHRLLRVVFRRVDVAEGRIVGYTLHVPFDRLLQESDDTPHLDQQAVRSATMKVRPLCDLSKRQ